MAFRADVAVPSGIAFLFGSALGLVSGWVMANGGQTELAAPRAAAAPQQGGGQASPADQEMQLRESLSMHEQLLASDPENPRLLRTVGEYQAALGEHETALVSYERARGVLQQNPDGEELPKLLFDQALSLAELDRYPESLALLEEAVELEPRNVTPRLIQVYIYMRRIMPAPPPGYDRQGALAKAELLLDEILQLQPGHPEATELKGVILSVRRSRQGAEGAGADTP